jgi:hypothetical protein
MIDIDGFENTTQDRCRVINGEIHERRVLHSFEVDDFQQILKSIGTDYDRYNYRKFVDQWMETEVGKWCVENCHDVSFDCLPHPAVAMITVVIRGYVSDRLWTYYILRWG